MRNSTDDIERLYAELDYRTEKILEELDKAHERIDYLEGNASAMFKIVQEMAARLSLDNQESSE